MFKEAFQLFNFLNSRLKKKIILFFIFLSIATIFEFLSIGIIFPGLNYIINSESKVFDHLINPVFEARCQHCHGPNKE